ncbi:MAG TPA: hypothetical protein VJ276_25495 [Thermoanaerobaculia bacterium]|nr:hypothetical protein [Thermoanaerobaculia bacterium]
MDEQRTAGRALTERILVRAPTGDDAPLIAQTLGGHGFVVVAVDDTSALAAEVAERRWDGAHRFRGVERP